MVQKLISKSQDLFNRKSTSILSAATIIGASYLISALLGLVRNHLLVARFFGGLEAELDVYFAAFVVPDTIFQLLVVGAVSAAFIPIYQEYFNKSKEEANELANASLTLVGLFFFVISLLIAIFARPIAGLLAHYPADKLDLMANLIRIMSIGQLLFTISSFLTGVLQSQRRFLIPAIAPLFYNIGTIIGIITLSSRFGIYSAAIGVVFGALFHMLIQLPAAGHLGYWPKLLWRPKHLGVRSMIKMMPPRALALALDQIERWVAVNLTSVLSIGSLSIFNFARQLYVLPISLFGVSLSQASFPTLAEEALLEDKTRFKNTLSKSILQIFFFALPASVLVLVLRIPLVRIAFGAKSFPWEATLLTGRSLAFLTLSIAPQAVTNTLTRALHAMKDTKTSLVIGFITMVAFVGLAYLFSSTTALKSVAGITLALSLGNLLDFVLSYFAIRRKVGSLQIAKRISKMLFASVITGFALWIPMRLLDKFVFDTTRTIPLIALTLTVSIVGSSVYFLLSWILKIEEFQEVRAMIKKIGNWRKILGESDEVLESTPNSI